MPAVAAEAQPILVSPAVAASVSGMIDGKYLGKYSIHDPATVKYVPRTEFIQSICGHIDHEETLEQIIASDKLGYSPEWGDLRTMAKNYMMWKNKGARLPKFSRWVTGMFAGNTEYAKILAAEGQKAAARKIIMSGDVVDILRCADTPHFRSCFDLKDAQPGRTYSNVDYHRVPVKIAEECPGIGIIYVDDENGFMLGRHWMHHAKIRGTGEDVVVLCISRYGCLEGKNIARLLAARGIKVGVSSYGESTVEVDFVGCFTSALHHDLNTWSGNTRITIIQP